MSSIVFSEGKMGEENFPRSQSALDIDKKMSIHTHQGSNF
jgi:hypothetical protein